jgi:hypothetical protein
MDKPAQERAQERVAAAIAQEMGDWEDARTWWWLDLRPPTPADVRHGQEIARERGLLRD